MATTTTNFGWDIPQSTDLVKDGATAIATLGQDIDTALVDLKGGTTGQVLTKNSGTDLDFVWATTYDSELSINAQTGTTYTFVLSDGNDTLVTASNASTQTYTIPPNSSVAFPTGTVLNLIRIGAGAVSFAQGAGVTIASTGATATAPALRVAYSAASAIKVATNTWYVVGDII
jgi:hypothetical protein